MNLLATISPSTKKGIIHAPLSIETFTTIWDEGSPEEWMAALSNHVYFPASLVNSSRIDAPNTFAFVNDKMVAIQRQYGNDSPLGFEFIALVMDLPDISAEVFHYLSYYFASSVAKSSTTPLNVLLLLFNGQNLSQLDKANLLLHSNVPIHVAAPYFLGKWNYQANGETSFFSAVHPKWKNLQIEVENKCDSYLTILGWDKETIANLPLRMKLEAIK